MKTTQLRTSKETVGKDRLKLRVEVGEEALSPAIDRAYKRWANEIRVPGFRKGKVPRQLIDARLGGPEAIREEAVRDALPDLYRQALRSEEVEAISPPEIEVVNFEPGSLVFEATVDVRPEVALPDLASLQIDTPATDVTDADVNEQLERLRERFAELETVSREARRGDFALIDLKGYRHDQPVEGASAPDLLYEIGSRSGPPKLDDELEGNRPGAILKFTDVIPHTAPELAGEEASFTVLVKEVKAKRLPLLDDEFAKTVGEFDTLEELKDDLRARLAEVKRQMVEQQIREAALDALVAATPLDPPDKLVEAEFEHRLEHFNEELKRAGMSMEDYGRQTQLTELEIRRDLRSGAARSVKAELLLEEVARQQQIDVTEEEVGREVAVAAARLEQDPKEVAQRLVSSGRLGQVVADIMRRKALDHVVAAITGEAGATAEETGAKSPAHR